MDTVLTQLKLTAAGLEYAISLLEKLQQQQNDHNIPNERKQIAIFLLAVLESVLNQQVNVKLVSHNTAKYILDAVRDQAYRQAWLK